MQIVREQRARADYAHLAVQNIEQLREFVNAVLTQPCADACNTGVVLKRGEPSAL